MGTTDTSGSAGAAGGKGGSGAVTGPGSGTEGTAAVDAPGGEPESTESKVRRWISDNFAGTALARNTECWNLVQGAVPALVALIDAP